MKKNLSIWRHFSLAIFLFLFSCRNEDFSNSLAESKREEEFFRNNDENTNSKKFNASLVSSTISKLKKINDKTDFYFQTFWQNRAASLELHCQIKKQHRQ